MDDFWYMPTPIRAAGVDIQGEKALTSTAVLAAVRILSEAVAQVPLHLYSRTAGTRRKNIAPEHPVYRLLHDAPNPEQTSFEFREMLQGSLLCYGNAYAEIQRAPSGKVIALWPLLSDRTSIVRDGGQVYVKTKVDGVDVNIPRDRALHLRGFTTSGLMGLSLIRLASNAIGLSIAQETYSAKHFENGAMPSSIIQRPVGAPVINDAGRAAIRAQVTQLYGGLTNAGRVALLEEGMTWGAAGISPKDSQLLEGKKFSVTDIARVFLIPPPMLMELDRATFTNIEHQGIQFVVYTLTAWLRRWEQRLGLDLLDARERDQYYAEFLVDGLLRGDVKTRYEAYASAIQNGWMSRNEVRDLENRDPVDGGDELMFQVNLAPVSDLSKPAAPEQDGDSSTKALPAPRLIRSWDSRKSLRKAYTPLIRDAYAKLAKIEASEILDAARKNLGVRSFDRLQSFIRNYLMHDVEFFEKVIAPVLASYGGALADAALTEIEGGQITEAINAAIAEIGENGARSHAAKLLSQLDELLKERADADPEMTLKVLESFFEGWETVDGVVSHKVVQYDNAVARVVWKLNGVKTITWQTDGDPCPLCAPLGGRTIGIEKTFVDPLEKLDAGEGKTPFQVSKYGVLHPPLHKGCNCHIEVA